MAGQPVKDMELKEKISKERFVAVLSQWADALEGNHDLNVTVKNQNVVIPADAASKASKLELEYEIDEGEYEFQLTMKWR